MRSTQGQLYKALRAQLLMPGISVGDTADFPRVEIHSFAENASLDKDGCVKTVACTVESMSTRSYGDAVTMNEQNLERLGEDGWHTIGKGLTILGVIPDQLTELTEVLDTQDILYRQLQRINVIIWQN